MRPKSSGHKTHGRIISWRYGEAYRAQAPEDSGLPAGLRAQSGRDRDEAVGKVRDLMDSWSARKASG